jgi:hypothetical protein
MIDTDQAVRKYDKKQIVVSVRMRGKRRNRSAHQVDGMEALLDLSSLLGLRIHVLEVGSRSLTIQAGFAMQESTALFRWAAGFQISTLAVRGLSVDWCRRGHVRDLLGIGVLAADLGDAHV